MVEFLKKISTKFGGTTEEEEIDDYLESLGVEDESFEEEADMWVKPFMLESDDDANAIASALAEGSIVIINIEPLYKRNKTRLKRALDAIKKYVQTIDGDVVRVSEYKLLATPKGVKVYRGKGKKKGR
jgi:SepF-like predicted cell division protein (DUF552 family)